MSDDPNVNEVEKEPILIKKIGNNETKVAVDKRKTISPYNSVKHLKYASKISAVCNTCKYRSVEAGGRGGCDQYKQDSVCTIRKDTKKLCDQLDTRNPETIDWMLDKIIKEGFQTIMLTFDQIKMDGNVPDKNSQREINNFVKLLQTWNDLKAKTSVTAAKVQVSENDDITHIFEMIYAKKQENKDTSDGTN